MNNKVAKITAIIIVVAMLVLGVALTICGLIYTANEDNIAFLVFLDNAGADDKFVSELLDYLEDNYQIMIQCLSGEIPPSDDSICQIAVDLTELLGRFDGKDLGDAAYGYLHDQVSLTDVGVIGRYPSIVKYRDFLKNFGHSDEDNIREILKQFKSISYQHIQILASQFVTLCNYISSSGKNQLSYTVDTITRAIQYKEELLDYVSLREIITSVKYVSQGLKECKSLDVTFGVLNLLTANKFFSILSQSPQLITSTLNFVSEVEIDTIADVASYTFAPNICVALLHTLNDNDFINSDNVEQISQEIDEILTQLDIENSHFKQFYLTVNQVDFEEQYLFNPQDLSPEQEEYICNFINPIIDGFNSHAAYYTLP
ncbi:MAG: hypothetical protein K2N53_03765 [Clostridia bacterium]|nr:hypothetical protein [Clostridia bacterium]